MQPDDLKPCPECGAPCSVQVFTGSHIVGEATLWMCSKAKYLGGACPDENAYLSEDAWNTRAAPALPPAPEIEALVENLLRHGAQHELKYNHTGICGEAAAALQSQAAETARLRAMCEELAGVVKKAGERFREYERHHMMKGNLDGDVKARSNSEMADMCEAVLAQYQESKGGGR